MFTNSASITFFNFPVEKQNCTLNSYFCTNMSERKICIEITSLTHCAFSCAFVHFNGFKCRSRIHMCSANCALFFENKNRNNNRKIYRNISKNINRNINRNMNIISTKNICSAVPSCTSMDSHADQVCTLF